MAEISITDYFKDFESIVVFNDGKQCEFLSSDSSAKEILQSLNIMCEGGHDMPAFGVALDSDVQNEKQNGLWIELKFESTNVFNDMPFDSLLIRVEPKYTGFNIIRGQKGVYSGRCFYYSLTSDMSNLNTTVLKFAR